jgi:hypothetical protein
MLHCSDRAVGELIRLLLLAVAAAWLGLLPAGAQQPQNGTECNTGRISELKAQIEDYEARLRDAQDSSTALQSLLAAIRNELAGLINNPQCAQTKRDLPSGDLQPEPLPAPPGGSLGSIGISIGDCRVINCDCSNVSAGLLTGAYRRECLATEAELKKVCEESHIVRNKCHSTASGPNPFPK